MLHKETVSAETLDLIQRLMAEEELQGFKLVGGTALALMLGHRLSIDIDLFSDQPFNAQAVADSLSSRYHINNLETDLNTFTCFIEDVKVDCLTLHSLLIVARRRRLSQLSFYTAIETLMSKNLSNNR